MGLLSPRDMRPAGHDDILEPHLAAANLTLIAIFWPFAADSRRGRSS
jgi:hypothetical protein